MKKLLSLIFVACVNLNATTVSLHLFNPSTTPVTKDSFVRFDLHNYGANVPRIIGGGTIIPSYIDLIPDNTGLVTGTIIGNDVISPANTYYHVIYFVNGAKTYTCDLVISGGSMNLDNASCMTTTNPSPIPFNQCIQCPLSPPGSDGDVIFNTSGSLDVDTGFFTYKKSNKRLCIGPTGTDCGAVDLLVVPQPGGNPSILALSNLSTPNTCGEVGTGNLSGTMIIGRESNVGGCLGFGGLPANVNVVGNLGTSVNTYFTSVVSQASGTGGVSAVSVGVGGSGYSVNDILTLTGGGNGQAKVKVTTVAVGVITAVATLMPAVAGNGYVLGTYSVTGGTGVGATIQVTSLFVNQVNAILDGQLGDFITKRRNGAGSVTFANLGAVVNGSFIYCSNCDTPASPGVACTSAGDTVGAEAHGIRGSWDCF